MLKGFQKFFADLNKEARAEMCLGNPLPSREATERRLSNMAALSGGRGFMVPKKEPRTDAQGMTRGQRKRARDAKFRESFKAAKAEDAAQLEEFRRRFAA